MLSDSFPYRYVVSCGVRSVGSARGLSVLVQSAVASPPNLERLMEEWLLDFRATGLTELTAGIIGMSVVK